MKINSRSMAGWLSLLLFMLCCATLAYWCTQWLRPAPRVLAAPTATPKIDTAALGGLFGQAPQGANLAGDFQLKGVVVAANEADSIALLSVDGQPVRVLRSGAEVRSGVRVSEIQAGYIILSANGIAQRVALPVKILKPAVAASK